ncbi:hypothetical protein C2S51_026904 [Perilla frutescens var. frutescens]|nr:hypothetical protein C2S51_026904 [Perilla frutescens var. frutescens]
MDHFQTLPEESVSEILRRTSPADASRFAVISNWFKSAAYSDVVWDNFLPSDWPEIVSRSVSPVVYTTNKELYLTLCHYPILLDAGKLSFFLEKGSGKKCYMVGARELTISWGDNEYHWDWPSHPNSRFSKVAELRSVFWLDIRGKIKTQMLSPNTTYGAYLVYRLGKRPYGLEWVNAVVRFVDDEADRDAENNMHRPSARYRSEQEVEGALPVKRGDGWMEIEMGSFYNDRGNDGEAEGRLMEIRLVSSLKGLSFDPIAVTLISTNFLGMDRLSTLPEESLSEILWRTSPADASRFTVISKALKSAADSDIVWDRFLPSDLPEIVSRSESPVIYSTKKELYLSLCRSPILIDARKLSFSLEKKSGKKCYMMGARELGIAWGVDTPWYWEWTPPPHSRFEEVARLQSVCWLDIKGKINAQTLSKNTSYGAYLVFKLAERCNGVGTLNAVVRFVNDEEEKDAEARAAVVCLQRGNPRNRSRQRTGQVAVRRSDGWKEIELGSFCSGGGDGGDVEARLMEIKDTYWKSGLIVQGIEFRPKA